MFFPTLFRNAFTRQTRGTHKRPEKCRLKVESLEAREVPAILTPVMTGLDNPRGLAFGPGNAMYVVEAGRGGDGPSFETRPGVFASYGPTGAVSRLWHGQQERVAEGLPSLIAPDGATGPHDIAFHGNGNAYLTVGFGSNPTRRSELGEVGDGFAQVVRLLPNGRWENVTDIGTNEINVNPGGGPIDSNPYSLLSEAGSRVVVDAGGNALLRIASNGQITTLAEFPSRDDGRSTDAVPNSITVGPDGAYYVGELTGVPFGVGAARVYRVVPGEAPQILYTGLTAIIDLDFGPDGSLYVLQHATGPFLSGPGALIRISPDGTRTTLVSEGLSKPTSVLVGDVGAIFISNKGTSIGSGEVVRVTLDAVKMAWVFINDGTVSDRLAINTYMFQGSAIRAASLREGNNTLAGRENVILHVLGMNSGSEVDRASVRDRIESLYRPKGDWESDHDVDFGLILDSLDRWPGDTDFQ